MSDVADQERWDEELRQETRRELIEKLLRAIEGLQGWVIDSNRGQHVMTNDPNNCVDRVDVLDAIRKAGGE